MSKLFSDADCVVLDVTFQASVDLQYLMNVALDVTFQASVETVNIPLQVLTDIVVFGITVMMNPEGQLSTHCAPPSDSLRKKFNVYLHREDGAMEQWCDTTL